MHSLLSYRLHIHQYRVRVALVALRLLCTDLGKAWKERVGKANTAMRKATRLLREGRSGYELIMSSFYLVTCGHFVEAVVAVGIGTSHWVRWLITYLRWLITYLCKVVVVFAKNVGCAKFGHVASYQKGP